MPRSSPRGAFLLKSIALIRINDSAPENFCSLERLPAFAQILVGESCPSPIPAEHNPLGFRPVRARGSLDVVQQALDTHGVIVRAEEILKTCDGADIGSDLAIAEQIPQEVRRVAEVFQRDAHFVPFGVREFDKSLSAFQDELMQPTQIISGKCVKRLCQAQLLRIRQCAAPAVTREESLHPEQEQRRR